MVDTQFALVLSEIEGIGPIKYRNLIQHFSNYDEFINNNNPQILSECGLSNKIINKLTNFSDWDKIDKIIERTRKDNISIICLGQDDYPELLSHIYSPPTVLYIKGNSELLNRPAVAIVGSRTPTSYGRSMASKIAADLAAAGLIIISGMALGIDSEAHRATLEIGGYTGAIFGTGIDTIYPAEHRELAAKISQKGYCLSEFSLGTFPDRHNFPRRNRIISGLSLAVVVVEAAARSGALVTADIAAEQGKDVFAVPGPADSSKSDGTINLLKQGAYVATCAEDILQNLGWLTSSKLTDTDNNTMPLNIELEPEEQKVCDMITTGALHFDELVRNLNLTSPRLSAILLKLELAGLVVRRPGNYLARA